MSSNPASPVQPSSSAVIPPPPPPPPSQPENKITTIFQYTLEAATYKCTLILEGDNARLEITNDDQTTSVSEQHFLSCDDGWKDFFRKTRRVVTVTEESETLGTGKMLIPILAKGSDGQIQLSLKIQVEDAFFPFTSGDYHCMLALHAGKPARLDVTKGRNNWVIEEENFIHCFEGWKEFFRNDGKIASDGSTEKGALKPIIREKGGVPVAVTFLPLPISEKSIEFNCNGYDCTLTLQGDMIARLDLTKEGKTWVIYEDDFIHCFDGWRALLRNEGTIALDGSTEKDALKPIIREKEGAPVAVTFLSLPVSENSMEFKCNGYDCTLTLQGDMVARLDLAKEGKTWVIYEDNFIHCFDGWRTLLRTNGKIAPNGSTEKGALKPIIREEEGAPVAVTFLPHPISEKTSFFSCNGYQCKLTLQGEMIAKLDLAKEGKTWVIYEDNFIHCSKEWRTLLRTNGRIALDSSAENGALKPIIREKGGKPVAVTFLPHPISEKTMEFNCNGYRCKLTLQGEMIARLDVTRGRHSWVIYEQDFKSNTNNWRTLLQTTHTIALTPSSLDDTLIPTIERKEGNIIFTLNKTAPAAAGKPPPAQGLTLQMWRDYYNDQPVVGEFARTVDQYARQLLPSSIVAGLLQIPGFGRDLIYYNLYSVFCVILNPASRIFSYLFQSSQDEEVVEGSQTNWSIAKGHLLYASSIITSLALSQLVRYTARQVERHTGIWQRIMATDVVQEAHQIYSTISAKLSTIFSIGTSAALNVEKLIYITFSKLNGKKENDQFQKQLISRAIKSLHESFELAKEEKEARNRKPSSFDPRIVCHKFWKEKGKLPQALPSHKDCDSANFYREMRSKQGAYVEGLAKEFLDSVVPEDWRSGFKKATVKLRTSLNLFQKKNFHAPIYDLEGKDALVSLLKALIGGCGLDVASDPIQIVINILFVYGQRTAHLEPDGFGPEKKDAEGKLVTPTKHDKIIECGKKLMHDFLRNKEIDTVIDHFNSYGFVKGPLAEYEMEQREVAQEELKKLVLKMTKEAEEGSMKEHTFFNYFHTAINKIGIKNAYIGSFLDQVNQFLFDPNWPIIVFKLVEDLVDEVRNKNTEVDEKTALENIRGILSHLYGELVENATSLATLSRWANLLNPTKKEYVRDFYEFLFKEQPTTMDDEEITQDQAPIMSGVGNLLSGAASGIASAVTAAGTAVNGFTGGKAGAVATAVAQGSGAAAGAVASGATAAAGAVVSLVPDSPKVKEEASKEKPKEPEEPLSWKENLLKMFTPTIKEVILYLKVLNAFRSKGYFFEGDAKFFEIFVREFISQHVVKKLGDKATRDEISEERTRTVERLLKKDVSDLIEYLADRNAGDDDIDADNGDTKKPGILRKAASLAVPAMVTLATGALAFQHLYGNEEE